VVKAAQALAMRRSQDEHHRIRRADLGAVSTAVRSYLWNDPPTR
jgi:hypothetical protein